MRAHVIQIDAQTSAGAAAPVYLASVDDARLCHLNGVQWVPAIAKLPSLSYDFFGGDFNGAIGAPTGSFAAAIEGISGFTGLRFASARVRLWSGDLGAAWGGFTLRFDGEVKAEPVLAAGIASFSIGAKAAWLDKPLLSLLAGTGGVEGGTDLQGQVKPLVLGAARFVPGVLIDAVNNVYLVSGYGLIQSVDKVYDRVVALGATSGDYANLAALVAASIPNGGWATCLASGLVRLGAPAAGQVSFDISGDKAGAGGYVRKPGALIRRIAELAGGTVDTANLAALDTARAWNLALVLMAQTTAREAIQQIADSVCAVAGISWTGTLFVAPLGFGTASQTLKADGSALPPVASVAVQPVAAPFWRLATDSELTWTVHDWSNVSTEYLPRGKYSASAIYRLDDMVTSDDGSVWVYINSTASAGHAPPIWPTTSNAWWSNTGVATAASWSLVTGAGKPADNATVGAPAGTSVGTIAATDVSTTIKSGGGVADDQVGTPALVDNATWKAGSIAVDFGHYRTTPGYGSWLNVSNGFTTVEVSLTTGADGAQKVKLTAVLALQGDGSSADNTSWRVLRNGTDVVGQVWDNVQILNDRIMTYAFIFWDDSVSPSTTYTYTLQWMPIASDGYPYWDNISFDAEGKWK